MSKRKLYTVTMRPEDHEMAKCLPIIRMLRRECVKYFNGTTISTRGFTEYHGDHLYAASCDINKFRNCSFMFSYKFTVRKSTMFAMKMMHDIADLNIRVRKHP